MKILYAVAALLSYMVGYNSGYNNGWDASKCDGLGWVEMKACWEKLK